MSTLNDIGGGLLVLLFIGFVGLGANLIAQRLMPYPTNRGDYRALVTIIFVLAIMAIIGIADIVLKLL